MDYQKRNRIFSYISIALSLINLVFLGVISYLSLIQKQSMPIWVLIAMVLMLVLSLFLTGYGIRLRKKILAEYREQNDHF
jgi:membrane protein YdbS with pleckstrin-like domain